MNGKEDGCAYEINRAGDFNNERATTSGRRSRQKLCLLPIDHCDGMAARTVTLWQAPLGKMLPELSLSFFQDASFSLRRPLQLQLRGR